MLHLAKGTKAMLESLVACIQEADREKASVLLDQWIELHGVESMITEFLSPAMERLGEMWARNKSELSLAQGYVASKVAEDALAKTLKIKCAQGVSPGPLKGPVVLGNAQDDCHPLGRRMVSAFLKMEGWDVVDLGIDVTPEAFIQAVRHTGAKVIGVSAMMQSTARNIPAIRRLLDESGLSGHVQLAVGGAIFRLRPELVAQVGADGTAVNALDAPRLFAQLLEKAEQFSSVAP